MQATEKKLTGTEKENAIQEEAQKIARRVLFFECSETVKALLRDSEKNWKESPIDFDEFNCALDCCPECGSAAIISNNEGNSWYRCKDCGATFDDLENYEVSQYWFFDRNYWNDFVEYGARVVETEDCPIWLRYGCNYGWELEGVFRYIAEKNLRDCGIID